MERKVGTCQSHFYKIRVYVHIYSQMSVYIDGYIMIKGGRGTSIGGGVWPWVGRGVGVDR